MNLVFPFFGVATERDLVEVDWALASGLDNPRKDKESINLERN
jgi:hypothetical protein